MWADFKQLIYEIYDNRIWFTPEIAGAVNTTYMGMDEHLIVFFTLRYKVRPVIEKRIIEFLASLKYFMDSWHRAKQYAQLAGFLQTDEAYGSVRKSGASSEVNRVGIPMKLNEGRLDELELPQNDIFILEFFLHAYSMVKDKGGNFQESVEGFTYM